MAGGRLHRNDARRGDSLPVHRQSFGRAAALAAVLAVSALAPSFVHAQCPYGSPPPCARPVAVARPVSAAAPDPQRIAVLPFRVTTADSLLGEGLAELVATEFTGESGPRAVNMGTVLRAWRTAGGGLRSPLAQDRAERLARDIGAGRYVEGSVVGLGQRLTINASVVSVAGGDARRVTPITGTADSLDVLVGRLTSGLLAAAGVDRSADGRARLTDSPAAMREYLEGLAHWRASRLVPAAQAFERAFADDTLFARAAFMRWSAGQWGVAGPPWGPRVLALRSRLSAQDQLLITGPLGTGVPRSRAEAIAARHRAADQLPESAEAQYFVGDYFYHYGTALDINDHFDRARAAFERSVAIDSQGTVLQHLMEIALVTGDSALALRIFPGFDRVVGGAWDWGMAVAALAGDATMYAAQRRRAAPIRDRLPVVYVLADVPLSAAATDEIAGLAIRWIATGILIVAAGDWYTAAVVQGRPSVAQHALTVLPDSLRSLDEQVASAALADGDAAAGAAAVRHLRELATPDSNRLARTQCLVAYWDQARSGSAAWDDAFLRARADRCR